MNKDTLTKGVKARKDKFQEVLQLIFDNLNHGQTQKLLRIDAIKEDVDFFGIKY